MKTLTDEQVTQLNGLLDEAKRVLSTDETLDAFVELVNADEVQINLSTDRAKDVWAKLLSNRQ